MSSCSHILEALLSFLRLCLLEMAFSDPAKVVRMAKVAFEECAYFGPDAQGAAR